MGLFQKAYETYGYHKSLVGKIEADKSPLLPISHIMQNVNLEISINLEGNFVSVRILDNKSKSQNSFSEQRTIIPVTIKSGSRSGKNPVAHPLSDKLAYLIKSEDSKHKEYMQLLSAWEGSVYADEKLTAIKKYLESGTLLKDLVHEKVLELDKDGKISTKKINGTEPLQCLVRWRVYGCMVEECWRDQRLFDKWIAYYNSLLHDGENFTENICMISGKKEILATMVPKGIVNVKGQSNAKLISSNDEHNFVFRGRFINAEQSSSVGYDTFQKVFVILQWLANNSETSFSVAGRTFLCWNPKGKVVPQLNTSIFGTKAKATFTPSDYQKELREILSGFRNSLPDDEDVAITAFDAATQGRLSVVYYNELKASDFLDRINSWYNSCYWYFGKEVASPTLYNIVNFAFGVQRGNKEDSKVEVDERILKQHMQRLIKCLLEKQPIPFNVVTGLVAKASLPQSYSKKNRKTIISIACSVIRKYYNDKASKEEWTMNLDKNNCDRSYLFGRLLAVMEKVEWDTYNAEERERRETNAIRLQSAYCAKPFMMMKTIHEKLNPYFAKLKPKPGLEIKYRNLIGEIIEKIADIDKSLLNKPLEPTYLLGYYLQRNDLYTSQKDKNEEAE